jgi:chemotaxis family two-component system response regulator Rcp1
MESGSTVEILLVEDNPGDVRLITDALAETDVRPVMRYVKDGVEAMHFLRREAPFESAPRPGIIVLDLNLPRRDGLAVLKEIKSDPVLALTPVIIFSGSDAPQAVTTSYALGANCYIVKPRDLYNFTETIRCLVDLWLRKAKLPGWNPDTRGTNVT